MEMSNEALVHVAAYFQVLAEPSRLRILSLLRGGERNVGDLARSCALSPANVSRHLAQLARHGLVAREARGNAVYYRVADASVPALCDLVCGTVARRLEAQFLQRPRPAPADAPSAGEASNVV